MSGEKRERERERERAEKGSAYIFMLSEIFDTVYVGC